MTLQHLQTAALHLTPRNRVRLAQALVSSLGTLSPASLENAWTDEALRRDREIESGKAKEVSGTAALRRIRAKLA